MGQDRSGWGCPPHRTAVSTPSDPHGGETMNPVVHFEMPYDNRERMAKFYGSAFGWRTEMLGTDMGNYVLATTTETDESGPKDPGRINGGFFPKRPDWPAQYPSIVIAVDDVRAATRVVTCSVSRWRYPVWDSTSPSPTPRGTV